MASIECVEAKDSILGFVQKRQGMKGWQIHVPGFFFVGFVLIGRERLFIGLW